MKRQTVRRSLTTTPQEPAINITPLIDVVFVVLIAFIVIAPLLEMDHISLARGGSFHSPVHLQNASSIQIHVYQNNSVALNGKKITLDQLPNALREIKRQFPKSRPQLFHDKKAYFGTYQLVKNSLEAIGFEEVDIILSPT